LRIENSIETMSRRNTGERLDRIRVLSEDARWKV